LSLGSSMRLLMVAFAAVMSQADLKSDEDPWGNNLKTRVVLELTEFGKHPQDLGPSLLDALMSLFLHAAHLPDNDDDYSTDAQLSMIKFTTEVQKLYQRGENWRNEIKGGEAHKAAHMVNALLTATAGIVPLCRTNDVCAVDKTALALWRFANADSENLQVDGFGQKFFKRMYEFLPPSAKWQTPWQCPTKFEHGLAARPVWTLETLPEGSAAKRLVETLQAHATEIVDELHHGVLSKEGKVHIRDPAWSGLHENGRWMAFSVYRSEGFFGRHAVKREFDPMHCRLIPRTCQLLREAGVPPGLRGNLPSLQGSRA